MVFVASIYWSIIMIIIVSLILSRYILDIGIYSGVRSIVYPLIFINVQNEYRSTPSTPEYYCTVMSTFDAILIFPGSSNNPQNVPLSFKLDFVVFLFRPGHTDYVTLLPILILD
jgi:chromate transport protein ChrA